MLSGWKCAISRNFGRHLVLFSLVLKCTLFYHNFIPLTPVPQFISCCIISWFPFPLALPTSPENTSDTPWSFSILLQGSLLKKELKLSSPGETLTIYCSPLPSPVPDFTHDNSVLLNKTAWLTNFPVTQPISVLAFCLRLFCFCLGGEGWVFLSWLILDHFYLVTNVFKITE